MFNPTDRVSLDFEAADIDILVLSLQNLTRPLIRSIHAQVAAQDPHVERQQANPEVLPSIHAHGTKPDGELKRDAAV